ncbi:TetR/AcrR family transcriptional regulator [Azospirillum sp. ST 5-10]|uniref:TetR/AcrR family transcriptional regulator n=1 Tax=unclassified Azospirillum TaxID=2630922 RepID=UPI003F4A6102
MRRASGKAGSSRKALLRQSVLDAAATLFAERGFAGTSFQDIADALNVGRTALYYYFKSKEEVLASLVEEVTVVSDRQSAMLAARTDDDPAEVLRSMVRGHVELLLSHALQFRVVDRTEVELPPDLRAVHDRSKRAVLTHFTGQIARGVEKGVFRQVDAQVAAFAIIGMCSWTTWWFHEGGRKTAREVAEILADLAVHGLSRAEAPPGTGRDPGDVFRAMRENLDYLELAYNQGRKGRR